MTTPLRHDESRPDPPRIERVRDVLDRALEHPSHEREGVVELLADGDAALRDEVLSLLRALADGGDLLEPATPARSAPPLTGLTFGTYRVGARIGAGGMGVVYEATDTRLKRTVAVKALPGELAMDPHRRARFEREARIVATLHHPNIAAIHAVEETDAGPVMVLEFAPGPTLAELIKRGPLHVAEALDIARQVARALEAAHTAGIIHRDLKPANIKVMPGGGGVKVLDFGIAKVLPGSDAASAIDQTLSGTLIGTAAYMSPEQARARAVDKRTDLWAFGCVLFEMLTGRRPFEGETDSDTVAAVLREEPDWSRLPPGLPPGVERVLRRCLCKDPPGRLRDAGDAALDLDDPGPLVVPRRGRGGRTMLAAALVAGAGIGMAALWPGRSQTPATPVWFSITTPKPVTPTIHSPLVFSPDSKEMVFAAGDAWNPSRLFVRELDSLTPRPIAGVEDAYMPLFSPDGRWIGFWQQHKSHGGRLSFHRVPRAGGPPRRVLPDVSGAFGASWGDDGRLLIVVAPGLLRIADADSDLLMPLGADPDTTRELFSQPEILPGSRHALVTAWLREGKTWVAHVDAVDLSNGARVRLVEHASQPRFARELGLVTYLRGSVVYFRGLDPSGPRLGGEELRAAELGGHSGLGQYARYAVAPDGTLAFLPGDAPAACHDLAWFGEDGSSTVVHRSEQPIWTLRLSPDGSLAAYTTEEPDRELWVADLAKRTAVRLSVPGGAAYPVWTPDGSRIAFEHITDEGSEVCWMRADGSGTHEVLYSPPGRIICFPTGFSPDGGSMLVSMLTENRTDTDIFLVTLDAGRAARRLFPTSADRVAARFNPDGSLISYSSTETGRPEVYVHPFPSLDRKYRVSVEGGERPTWSADGARLFFRYADRLYAAAVTPDAEPPVATPTPLLDQLPGMRYDPHPDGTRFIMGRPPGEWRTQTTINVVRGALREK